MPNPSEQTKTIQELMAPLLSNIGLRQRKIAGRSLEEILNAIINVYLKHHNSKDEFRISIREIARTAGLNKDTVCIWVKKLIEARILIVVETGYCELNHKQDVVNKFSSLYKFDAPYILTNRKREESKYDSLVQNTEYVFKENNTENIFTENNNSVKCIGICNKDIELNNGTPLFITTNVRSVENKPWKLWSPEYSPAEKLEMKNRLDEERRIKKELKEKAKKARKSERRLQAQRAGELLSVMYSNCHRQEKYKYPIHPDALNLLIERDRRIAEGEKEYDVDQDMDKEYNKFYNLDRTELVKPYNPMPQPSPDNRKKCLHCEKEGHKRSMNIFFIRYSYFGAVRYRCARCKNTVDIWSEFPVFPTERKKTKEQLEWDEWNDKLNQERK